MIGKNPNRRTNQAQLIALFSLVFSIIAVILTLYTVLNVKTALQGYAASPFSRWTGFFWGPTRQPILPTKMPSVTFAPIIPTISTIPTALPQSFVSSTLNQGYGAPTGTHYNLNLIGIPKGKIAAATENTGSQIFLPLTGNCQILLGLGERYMGRWLGKI